MWFKSTSKIFLEFVRSVSQLTDPLFNTTLELISYTQIYNLYSWFGTVIRASLVDRLRLTFCVRESYILFSNMDILKFYSQSIYLEYFFKGSHIFQDDVIFFFISALNFPFLLHAHVPNSFCYKSIDHLRSHKQCWTFPIAHINFEVALTEKILFQSRRTRWCAGNHRLLNIFFKYIDEIQSYNSLVFKENLKREIIIFLSKYHYDGIVHVQLKRKYGNDSAK